MKNQQSERLEKIHLIICTLVAFCLTVGFVVQAVLYAPTGFEGLFTMAIWVSSSIVIFYFIGWVARALLINIVTPAEIAMVEKDELTDEFVEEPVDMDANMYNDTIFSESMIESPTFRE